MNLYECLMTVFIYNNDFFCLKIYHFLLLLLHQHVITFSILLTFLCLFVLELSLKNSTCIFLIHSNDVYLSAEVFSLFLLTYLYSFLSCFVLLFVPLFFHIFFPFYIILNWHSLFHSYPFHGLEVIHPVSVLLLSILELLAWIF